jgi:hypothetical protein
MIVVCRAYGTKKFPSGCDKNAFSIVYMLGGLFSAGFWKERKVSRNFIVIICSPERFPWKTLEIKTIFFNAAG